MRTSLALASTVALAGSALAQGSSCAQASRFGNSIVTTATTAPLVAGNTITVKTNYTCSAQFGIRPNWTDYKIGVYQNNNGHEPEYWLTRVNSPPTISTVTLKLPAGYYFANASYNLYVELTYPINGTDGTPVYVSGGQLQPLSIAPTV